ncbi:MAG: hypothetical protein KDA31_12150 [Phycisphaerales bacterium]|nr:hypothetical protein [Phycisphaerales bacterium]MCB9836750.1 hypothetical protein [Phycisphaera sp.]
MDTTPRRPDGPLEAIAKRLLDFDTLETTVTSADFREVAVWSVLEALEAAYEAGRRSAPPTKTVCPACNREIETRPL